MLSERPDRPLLAAGAARRGGPEAAAEAGVELGAHGVGIREEQIARIANLLAREAVPVAQAPEARAIAAKVPPRHAVIRRRVLHVAGDVERAARQHPVAGVLGQGADVDVGGGREIQPPPSRRGFEAAPD